MNENRTKLNQLLTDPAMGRDAAFIAKMAEQYPYMQVLHMLNGANETQPGIYGHLLWNEQYLQKAKEPVAQAKEPAATGQEENNDQEAAQVSVYNDDHLPYSFLWWLNKTRKDYEHTYKPFATSSAADKAKTLISAEQLARKERREQELLDQQIRENIFHLQDPEEKMSGGLNLPTIPFQVPKKSHPVIERFIQEEPKISPPKPEKLNLENKARKSASDDGYVVTETLAKIYEEQGLYPKALEVYEKLSLKFPEKSGYFAVRIAELKNKLI